jgi:pyocin large subunit-like protein
MPEFDPANGGGGFAAYRQAASDFMSGEGPEGSHTLYTQAGGMFRVQPSTGYFGYLNSGGTISTFFRPTDQDPFDYYIDQF